MTNNIRTECQQSLMSFSFESWYYDTWGRCAPTTFNAAARVVSTGERLTDKAKETCHVS